MALTPEIEAEDIDVVEETEEEIAPSKTWKMDFANGRLLNQKIDDQEAIKQFIEKTLLTERFRYPIYDDDYGTELNDLIGYSHTKEYLETVIPGLISDALMIDDRIVSVDDFVIVRESDFAKVSFIVETANGEEIRKEVDVVV